MKLIPMTFREANAYIAEHHSHSKPVHGMKATVGAVDDEGNLVGVAIVARPVARRLQDGETAEVTRVATDGHRNACSFLYGAAIRLARALGYTRVITYTLKREDAACVRASNFTKVGETAAQDWDRPSRPRKADHHEVVQRDRWEAA